MAAANETLPRLSSKMQSDPDLMLQVWFIRVMLELSLCLQFGLLISGYYRRMPNGWLVGLPSVSYVFYLAAEPATMAALTMILRSKDVRDDIPALLWTPFLLWYLGGPYNLTAYSVHDSQTWARHLTFFFIRLGATLYTCYKLGAGTDPPASILIVVLLLLAGTIKYAEKIWALWTSTAPQLVSRVFFGREEDLADFLRQKRLPDQFLEANRGWEELKILYAAYLSFKVSKLSFLGFARNHDKLEAAIKHRNLHLSSSSAAKWAFRWLGIQLELLHDTYYTKFSMPTIKYWRLSTNVIYILILIASILVFSTVIDHHNNYEAIDIFLTYSLICGTFLLECVSIAMQSFSHWTMVTLNKRFITQLWPLRVRLGKLIKAKKDVYMGQHDLVQQCFKDRPTQNLMFLARKYSDSNRSFVSAILNVKSFINRFFQSKLVQVDEKLKEYIYSYIRSRDHRDSVKRLIKQQQEKVVLLVLEDHQLHDFKELDGMSFIGLIFHLHIMTNVLHHREKQSNRDPRSEVAKRLSDYMMYLALVRPSMLPKGLTGDVIYKNLMKEVKENYPQNRKDMSEFARQLYDGKLSTDHQPSSLGAEEEEEEEEEELYAPTKWRFAFEEVA